MADIGGKMAKEIPNEDQKLKTSLQCNILPSL